MDAFTVDGWWWLPEAPKNRYGGTLTFDPVEGTRLKIMGSFKSLKGLGETTVEDGVRTTRITSDDVEASGFYPLVIGQVGSKPYTLESCRRIGLSDLFMNPMSVETISANRLYAGAAFASSTEASAITQTYRNFNYWMNRSSVAEEWEPTIAYGPNRHLGSVTLSASHLEPIRFTASPTLKGLVRHHLIARGDRPTARAINQEYRVTLSSKTLVPPEDLFKRASYIQHLASIGLDRTASILAVEFEHFEAYEWDLKDRARPPYRKPIDFYARLADVATDPGPDSFHHRDLLFDFHDIGGADGLSRWMAAAHRHASSLSRLMDTRYREMPYGQDRLLNRTAALEAFDRKINKNKKVEGRNRYLADRLNYCIDRAGPLFEEIVHDRTAWAELVVLYRNDTAHHLDRNLLSENSADHPLADSAFYLYIMCMADEAGFPAAVREKIRASQSVLLLRRELDGIIKEHRAIRDAR